jgi:molybdate transport system permease protein
MTRTPPARRRSASDRLFRAAFGSTLAMAVISITLILGGMAAFVSWPATIRWAFSTPEGREFVQQVAFSVRLSFVTSVTTTFLALALGIPAAYALSRFRYPLPLVVDTLLDLPIVLPPLVAGVALLTVTRYWLGSFFDALGLQVHYTARGIVVAQLFIAAPFAVRAIKAAFDDISPRYEEVSRTLGCTPFQAFFHVSLPLARHGILAGAIMTWARAISEFGPILIFCTASEKTAVLPIRVFLYNSAGDVAGGVVTSVILIIVAAGALLTFKLLGGSRLSL